MKNIDFRNLSLDHGGTILLAVMDGVGDITIPELGTELPLEAAETPQPR